MSGERIRSVKPDWLEDEKLASVSDSARMVSIALIVLSDDYGRGRANRLYLCSRIWPYSTRDPRETLASLESALQELLDTGFIRLYSVGGQGYFAVRNWAKHQKVDRPGKPRVPEPDPRQLNGCSRDPRETLARHSSTDLDLEVDQEVEVEGANRPPPPTIREPDALDSRAAAREWHRALGLPGAGNPGASHAERSWRGDYETIASACNAVDGDRLNALRSVCEWFWLAPRGPIQTKRIERRKASPAVLAKYVSRDLEEAFEWWSTAHPEAAQ